MRQPVFERFEVDSVASIGVSVGHWTNSEALTGCTVVLFDQAAPAVVDVRGGAPGTRETDVLAADRLVRSVDAIALCGGSAFGLAVADGVMAHLREQGRGVTTPAGPVPIVSAGVIFDLAVGQAIAPTAEHGRIACESAGPLDQVRRGRVGVGTGATTDKFMGEGQRGGFGIASIEFAGGKVTALVVVNAAGAVFDPATGRSVPGAKTDNRERLLGTPTNLGEGQATTLGVVLVDAPIDDSGLRRCAIAAHDAFARMIRPCHTIFDGDLVFATGLRRGTPVPAEVLVVAVATELAMERAILDAVTA
jgi:L-aminopeptidase/D-esterase-like protein